MANDVEMTMQPDEFADLRAQVALIAQGDVHLGRVLTLLLLHLGHSHGLDPVVEDARLKAEARKLAREEEDARLKVAADDREKARAAEDALPAAQVTPEAALATTRAAEDAQVKADAEALAKARAEEDALDSGEPAPQADAPVATQDVTPESAPAQEGA